jgi:hypothetical protein
MTQEVVTGHGTKTWMTSSTAIALMTEFKHESFDRANIRADGIRTFHFAKSFLLAQVSSLSIAHAGICFAAR